VKAIDEQTSLWDGYTYDIFLSEFFSTKAVVHCYGHADSSVTFSRVCAKEVMEIVKDLLPSDSKRQDSLPEHG
jgi:hypothetical protein